jgi:hypothetical protein
VWHTRLPRPRRILSRLKSHGLLAHRRRRKGSAPGTGLEEHAGQEEHAGCVETSFRSSRLSDVFTVR